MISGGRKARPYATGGFPDGNQLESPSLFLNKFFAVLICVIILRKKGMQMAPKTSTKDVRLHVVLPLELKEKLRRVAAGKGQKISVLVRESIEQKVEEAERQIFEERMREAYLEMAEENLSTVEDFNYADAKNL